VGIYEVVAKTPKQIGLGRCCDSGYSGIGSSTLCSARRGYGLDPIAFSRAAFRRLWNPVAPLVTRRMRRILFLRYVSSSDLVTLLVFIWMRMAPIPVL
jgi:hypothetical protein